MRIVSAQEESLEFDNGSKIISTYRQQCCEYNYADFSVLEIDPELMHGEFSDVILGTVVDEEGFNLIFTGLPHKLFGRYDKVVFIPCYSDQNGWYSTDVVITYFNSDGTQKGYFNLNAELRD